MRVNPLSNGFPNAEAVGERLTKTKTMSKIDMSRAGPLRLTKLLRLPRCSAAMNARVRAGRRKTAKLDCQAILAVEGSYFLLLLPSSFLLPFPIFRVPVLLIKYLPSDSSA